MTISASHLTHFRSLASLNPPRLVIVVAWLIFVGLCLAIAILFVPWRQTAQGGGQVISLDPDDRPQQVSSLVEGRVDRFFVQDGQLVKAGDPIVKVVDLDPNFLERLAAEKAEVQAQIAAVEQARAVASIDVGRTGQLFPKDWPRDATMNRRRSRLRMPTPSLLKRGRSSSRLKSGKCGNRRRSSPRRGADAYKI